MIIELFDATNTLSVIRFPLFLGPPIFNFYSPTIIKYETNGNELYLEWTKISGALYYEVELSPHTYRTTDNFIQIPISYSNNIRIELITYRQGVSTHIFMFINQ